MLLRKWEDIPEFMQNDDVKKYFDILKQKHFSLMLKRSFDIIMSLFLIVILCPVFIILALWIKFDSTGSVFYKQERITQYGRTFNVFKFRTMISEADQIGALITGKNDLRITRVGKKIRKSRLDEIPQLFNVLMGDMTFVGTRPEVKKYTDFYTDEMKATLLLPAGITSLASIKYKDEDVKIAKLINDTNDVDGIYISKILPEKMEYNFKYLIEYGFVRDVIICVKTIF